MKKSRFLALILVVSIMVMGAGYAAWTDRVVISNSVETGYLEVQFIDPNFAETEFTGSQYVNLQPVIREAKKVTFELSNLYPGATFTTLTEIQNKGTIPAKFDNAVVTFGGDNDPVLKDNILVTFDYWVFDSAGNPIDTIAGGTNVPLTQLEGKLNTTLAGLELQAGQSVSIGNPSGQSVDQYMNYEVNNGLTSAEDSDLTFDIAINWKQFNK